MLYKKLTKEELTLVSEEVAKVISSDNYEANFTGTTISPYNLQEYLIGQGFVDDGFDENSTDYWRTFIKVGTFDGLTLEMYFDAESFELKLYKPED